MVRHESEIVKVKYIGKVPFYPCMTRSPLIR